MWDAIRQALERDLRLGPFAEEGQPVTRHDSDGLWGYVSMRCANGMDGCDDLACVCRCHNAEPENLGRSV